MENKWQDASQAKRGNKMIVQVKMPEEIMQFYKSFGSVAYAGDAWYYLPFAIKIVNVREPIFEIVDIEDIPEHVKESLKIPKNGE